MLLRPTVYRSEHSKHLLLVEHPFSSACSDSFANHSILNSFSFNFTSKLIKKGEKKACDQYLISEDTSERSFLINFLIEHRERSQMPRGSADESEQLSEVRSESWSVAIAGLNAMNNFAVAKPQLHTQVKTSTRK